MKRVLHLISHLEEGGAQRQLSYVLAHTRKYEVEVASLIASPPEYLFPFFRSSSVPIHYLSSSSDFYAPQILPALTQLLRKGRYSFVHCWLNQAIVQGVFAARYLQIPVIASPRNVLAMLRFDRNKFWERILIRKTMGLADVALAPSSSVATELVGAKWVRPERVRIVHNGVDVDYFQPQGAGNTLVTVARPSAEKGIQEVRKIVDSVKTVLPDINCIVAGGIRGHKESDDGLRFTGFVSDIRSIFNQAAVVLNTSRVEGFSNAVLEAQAMGIPVVASDIGPNAEVVKDGVTGFLRKTSSQMADACVLLLQNKALHEEMSRNARARAVKKFSIAQQVMRIESIYDALL